jgi:acetyl esterase/lipase
MNARISTDASMPSPSVGQAPDPFALTLDPNYEGARTMTFASPIPAEAIPRFAPKRYGFNFAGWFYDAACTQPLSTESPAASGTTLYADWAAWDEQTRQAYGAYAAEMAEANYITARPLAYSQETFGPYLDAVALLHLQTFILSKPVTTDMLPQIHALKELRSKLEQVQDPEEGALYIWGDNMPQEENAANYDYFMAFDNKGFKPFLLPYILEDQANVKGNIIVIAGGGYSFRCNSYEGYPVAEYYNSIGYNAFVLQRRVAPSQPVDAHLDLQRSIRYLRYNARKLGMAATDKMVAIGFSGGGSTILGAVNDCYGNVLPTEAYPNYAPDDVDTVNSDLQAVLIIYGARPLQTDNPNLPKTFIAVGQNDNFSADLRSIELYKQLKEQGVHVDLHIFADSRHGFGLGEGVSNVSGPVNGTKEWKTLSKAFLDIELGYIPRTEPTNQDSLS